MSTNTATENRRRFAAACLFAGPLLMAVGDLFHPAETGDAMAQTAIIIEHANRWYISHLLLFAGLVILVPGILGLTGLMAERKPAAAHAAQTLILIGMVAFSAIFVFEMLIARYIRFGADQAAAQALFESFSSIAILGVVAVAALGFFAGVGIVTTVFAQEPQLRWPALLFGLGALLILTEIVTAQVLFSQIGNVVLFAGCAGFARHVAYA